MKGLRYNFTCRPHFLACQSGGEREVAPAPDIHPVRERGIPWAYIGKFIFVFPLRRALCW